MVSRKYDEMDLRRIPAGTIRIDCSGAYIANDHLIRGNASLLATPTPSPVTSDESLSSDEDETTVFSAPGSPAKDSKSANITLPRHNSEVIHISVDIGGTLTKLVYFTSLSVKGAKNGGKLHFQDFQTGAFETEALQFMIRLVRDSMGKKHGPPITYIISTGGGAHKFSKLMTSAFKKNGLPMQIVKKDEMECLIKGLDWLITKIPHEIFTYDLAEDNIRFNNPPVTEQDIYPYLLVNIGSGVSMVKVTGPGPEGFERIGGSSLGGGTLWGLLLLLTDASDYNEMLEMAQKGDNENIDLLVGDIYGTSYNKIGLKSNHIASSFAKVFKKLRFNKLGKKLSTAEKLAHFRQEDIARSLLYLVSNNIGQIAYLQACRFGLKRIYFGGSYISGHMQTIHTLSYALNFWSNGEMQSYFLRHEGYLGSVGAFIMGPNGVEPHSPGAAD
ncbi:fumble-domain-containing protein [Metschnikowia bicuspidata var. bicuspidata NRRL YB-4993]|uniref:Fumble-domain-containing protein n=1 Tax=Metschnikowia bicuspidata var. bicuspidata NRRL YB-4993 TaxID=869754 RepID=A0A1A0HCU0_9ASCO|nr:fumble-domain-containing protein [Metschnikowia bicuspidata var. bicuspidata NRRL YB-4993]OBA21795.1 fumble-domain-containing protein [Metschnikowia bicuspidata var. bicuspidata NRRL YB-4993]